MLAVPTILSSLVTVLYNLADTYFVALLGDPLRNAAVTLAAPAMLAFNAISNLFGVGSSTMMIGALLGLCREADRSVYGRPGDCRDRGDVSAGICTGAALSVPGLSGCGGVPGGGAWARYALLFAVLRKVVLEIPALLLLNFLFPLYGLAYAQFTAELCLAIAAVVLLVRLFRQLELEQEGRAAGAA